MSTDNSEVTRSSTSIMERARAAQAAKRAADEAARYEYAERQRAQWRSEWRPIVDAVLAQVKHQLGDDSEVLVEEDPPGAYYYGAGWILARPEGKTTLERDLLSSIAYRPMKLAIEGIRTPVMCWSDGRTQVCFEPADIVLDDKDDYADLYLGGDAMTDWGIQTGNSNLLVAIAEAADKETEYLEKARRVQRINEERATMATTMWPDKPAPDNLENANEVLWRFATGDYCVTAIDTQAHDDDNLKYSDNRAFLIASQIYALARELRGLRDDMEAKRYA